MLPSAAEVRLTSYSVILFLNIKSRGLVCVTLNTYSDDVICNPLRGVVSQHILLGGSVSVHLLSRGVVRMGVVLITSNSPCWFRDTRDDKIKITCSMLISSSLAR